MAKKTTCFALLFLTFFFCGCDNRSEAPIIATHDILPENFAAKKYTPQELINVPHLAPLLVKAKNLFYGNTQLPHSQNALNQDGR